MKFISITSRLVCFLRLVFGNGRNIMVTISGYKKLLFFVMGRVSIVDSEEK